jgi:hypothetical protein
VAGATLAVGGGALSVAGFFSSQATSAATSPQVRSSDPIGFELCMGLPFAESPADSERGQAPARINAECSRTPHDSINLGR